jgi:hypothetical protein
MAARARHPRVRAGQGKPSLAVMVESYVGPPLGLMAPRAARGPVPREPPLVGIPVAGRAVGRSESQLSRLPLPRRGKPLFGEPRHRHHLVARVARHCEVRSGERKRRLLVLRRREPRWDEPAGVVARLAAPPVRPARELAPMNVRVTVHARGTRQRLRPTRRMALRASDVLVPPDQGVPRAPVVEPDARRPPGLGGVALRAASAQPGFVRVSMTRGARLERRPPVDPRRRPRLRAMALVAGHLAVCAREGKCGAPVIEASRELTPARRRVAACAALPLPPLVGVGVARLAAVERDTGQPPPPARPVARVATIACHRSVLAQERKSGPRVVECRHRPPRRLRVARRAGRRGETSPMDVGMARRAVHGESQERTRGVRSARREARGVRDSLRVMALVASKPRVRAFERMPGLRVIERRPPFLSPEDELEVPSMVLDVAPPAFLVAGLRVQPLPRLDPRRQRRVARQAFVRGYTSPRLVAFQAPRAAVEGGVGAAQLSRRDLGPPRGGTARDEEGEAHQPSPPVTASTHIRWPRPRRRARRRGRT